ncbi:MAG TPA: glycosyltransferase, partial [Candidatus Acidoferrales bacterium]
RNEALGQTFAVSVVIPCFNHGEFVAGAVGSVTAMKRDDVELIVVDDGSTDSKTRSEMERLAAQGVRVIRQANRGLAGARNAGIAASTGKYILPLDADNRLRAAYVEKGSRILDENPKVGVVYGDAEYIGERSGRWRLGEFDANQLLQWNSFDACAIYRRCIWEQNGGYDSTMPVQGLEDWDFWLGALEHGWEIKYVPEILFEYRVAADSMLTRANPHNGRVEEFVAKKHALLYRKAWMELAHEHRSVMRTAGNLGRLMQLRIKTIFGNGRSVS